MDRIKIHLRILLMVVYKCFIFIIVHILYFGNVIKFKIFNCELDWLIILFEVIYLYFYIFNTSQFNNNNNNLMIVKKVITFSIIWFLSAEYSVKYRFQAHLSKCTHFYLKFCHLFRTLNNVWMNNFLVSQLLESIRDITMSLVQETLTNIQHNGGSPNSGLGARL